MADTGARDGAAAPLPSPGDEFALIDLILDAQPAGDDRETLVPAGDDAAVIAPPVGHDLVVSVDTLVEGVHFLPDTPPALAVHRALAVNLSDLAAMGAAAGPCLLALTHPALTPAIAAAIGRGFATAAQGRGARLVGGNIARGPFTVSVTVNGWVPHGRALLRRGARPGDLLWVSGQIGAGADGLARLRAAPERLAALADATTVPDELRAYLAPVPRLGLGAALRDVASACIDVSDGLLADLGHLLGASGVGAEVHLDRLPAVGPALEAAVAGDDYELLFTAPAARRAEIEALAAAQATTVTQIGRIEAGSGLRLLQAGAAVPLPAEAGWRHFA